MLQNSVIFIFMFYSMLKINAESYTSIFELEAIFQKQNKLLHNEFQSSMGVTVRNRSCIRDLIKNDLTAKTLAEHPISAYKVIKCFNQLNSSEFGEDDLKGAALSIVRLQDTYNLNIKDIIIGKILQFQAHVQLSVDDCVLIAQQAFFNLQLESAANWLAQCMQMINLLQVHQAGKLLKSKNSENIEEFHKSLNLITNLVAGMWSPDVLQGILHTFPEFSEAALQLLTEDKAASEFKKQLNRNSNYLCQGLLPNVHQMNRLICFLKHSKFSYIPFLVEKLYESPEILLYHKFISHGECGQLQKLASPKLVTTKVHRFDDGLVQTHSGRIGKMAWLSKNDYGIVKSINQRIEMITQLSTESAEDLQVLNYGIGGHYEIHVDFFDSNRINDVKYGGMTVFPEIGVSVSPSKGSALVWHNLNRDGTGDYRTLHAACPVVIGTKWVANVWLHEMGQENHQICTA